MDSLHKAGLYFRTIKYLDTKQIMYNIKHKLFLQPYRGKFNFNLKEPVVNEDLISTEKISWRPASNGAKERAKKILNGNIPVLGRIFSFDKRVRWDEENQRFPWKLYIHCFNFAFDLAVTSYKEKDGEYFEKFKILINDWIQYAKKSSGLAWNPFAVSLRIVNWIYSFFLFYEYFQKDKTFKSKFLTALLSQSVFLEKVIEYDKMGNHLIKNAKALLFSGYFFDTSDTVRWRKKGVEIFKGELEKQILSDGGHFERSPMYHCIVLNDILDCIPLLTSTIYNQMKDKAYKMLEFLDSIVMQDHDIPLFSDSNLRTNYSPSLIFTYSDKLQIGFKRRGLNLSELKIKELRDSGYFTFRNENLLIIIDGGKIAPDYLPAHGHCDLFSYELSFGGKRFIVDSGNYEYEIGDMRDYCRSTEAHNTLKIDNHEQAEIWASFRAGRRAKLKGVRLKEKNNISYFTGYYSPATLSEIIHRRWIFLCKEKFWLFIDKVWNKNEYNSKRKYKLENFIHLHPEVSDIIIDDKLIKIKRNNEILNIIPLNCSVVKKKGWYCPEFGKRIENQVLNLNNTDNLPVYFGYIIIPNKIDSAKANIIYNDKVLIKVKINSKNYRVMVDQIKKPE